MSYDERYSKIKSYVTQLIYYDGKNITEDMKPQNEEEQKYFEKIYEWELEQKQKDENYQKRDNLATMEAEEIYKKYSKKEFWSNGIFSYFKLKKYKKEIAPKVKELMSQIIDEKMEPYYDFICPNGELSHVMYHLYYENIEHQILEEKYGIKKSDLEKGLPDEYYNEIEEIEKKYNVRLPSFWNK